MLADIKCNGVGNFVIELLGWRHFTLSMAFVVVDVVSAGVAAFREISVPDNGGMPGMQVFLIQQKSGRWGLPKGRMEAGESVLQTAIRELQEETGLTEPVLLADTPRTTSYTYTTRKGTTCNKSVHFFGATVTTSPHSFPTSEIRDGAWVNLLMTADRTIDCIHVTELLQKDTDTVDIIKHFAAMLMESMAVGRSATAYR
jgi:8-oxo-dGTP pyrophosphatase MutT (NUDIX family)